MNLRLSITVWCVLIYSSQLMAQSIGGGLMAGLPHHRSTMKGLPGLITCCAGYDHAFGTSVGMSGLYRLDVLPRVSLQASIVASTESVTFIADESTAMDGGGMLVDGTIRHTLSASMPWVSADVMGLARMSFEPRLSFGIGARMAYLLASTFEQESRIITPSNVRFENGARVRNSELGTIANHAAAFGSILGRIGWRLEQPLFVVEPHISLEFGLTNLVDGVQWKRNSYRAGVDVLFNLGAEPLVEPEPISPPQPMPDLPFVSVTIGIPFNRTTTLVLPTLKRSLKLDLVVTGTDIYGDSVAADELKFRNVLSRVMAPMLPYIFHEEGDSIPAGRYSFTQSAAEGFNLDTLQRTAGILDIHYQSLNVIGERMRRHPEASLTIIGNGAGAGSEADNLALATARAAWSKEYLTRVWGIEPQRLNASSHVVPRQPSNMKTPAGWQENRRTEFSSSTPEILEPFLIQDTVLTSNLALVKVQPPAALTGVDVETWAVDVVQGETVLDSFSGRGAVPDEGVTWNLIDHRKLNVRDAIPIILRLRVRTADGQELDAEKAIPTSVDYRLRDRLEQYNLVVFGYNSSELTEDHLRITNRVRSMLGSNVEIKIVGYADKTGNYEYNRKLSAKRALSVAEAIQVPASMAGGVGFTDLLFDNTTPEGRFFCRTVRIFVKTNMK